RRPRSDSSAARHRWHGRSAARSGGSTPRDLTPADEGDLQVRAARGPTIYEAPLGTRARTTLPAPPPPPPMPWQDTPAPPALPAGPVLSVAPIAINPGLRAHLIVRLRDPVRAPAA